MRAPMHVRAKTSKASVFRSKEQSLFIRSWVIPHLSFDRIYEFSVLIFLWNLCKLSALACRLQQRVHCLYMGTHKEWAHTKTHTHHIYKPHIPFIHIELFMHILTYICRFFSYCEQTFIHICIYKLAHVCMRACMNVCIHLACTHI